MATLLKSGNEIEEGSFFCRWLRSRLIKENKNVLGVELGSTGSGKSYRDLRKAELWYKFYFNEPFPVENICFGVLNAMERISSGKLRRGEVIIFEEAGANLGNLDFQNRVSKLFTYVLQSFRSMNIAIFFNLPYYSMLNKSARMLMHYSFESGGVDKEAGLNFCRPKFHQVNQDTGKVYKKYPKTRVNGNIRKIKQFAFQKPSQYLIDAYEQKKEEYLNRTTSEYTEKIRELEEKDKPRNHKESLFIEKPYLEVTFNDNQQGLSQTEIAKKEGISQSTVNGRLKTLLKYGYPIRIHQKTIRM